MKKKTSFFLVIIFLFFMINPLIGQSVKSARVIDLNAYPQSIIREETLDPIMSPKTEKFRIFEYNTALKYLNPENKGDLFDLTFFQDSKYTAEILNVFISDVGNTVITAKIHYGDFAYIFLVIDENSISFSAKIPERDEFYFASTKDNISYLGKSKISDIVEDELGCSVCELPAEYTMPHDLHSQLKGLTSRNEVIISLLYVYTPAAALWASISPLVTDINHVIDLSLATANLVMENSSTGITFVINYRYQTDYAEVDNSNDFQRFTNPNDGYMDEVHVYRDTFSADIMVLLADISYTGGTAWLLSNVAGWVAQGWDNYTVCINRVQQTASSFTVVHEIGHNMGAHHHRDQNVQPGPNYPLGEYTSGWRNYINGVMSATVMSYTSGTYYSDGINATGIPYFSSPLISINGTVIGDALLYDNTRVLLETKEVTANYRAPLYDCDLYALSITGPIQIPVSLPAVFSIQVANRGYNAAIGYNIHLMQIGNDIPLDTVSGEPLLPWEATEYHLFWLPEQDMQTQIYGLIDWDLDENELNNQTDFLFVTINPAGTAYSENFDTGTNYQLLGWTGNLFSISGIVTGIGVGNSHALNLAATGGIINQYAVTPLIDNITHNTILSFAYRITDYPRFPLTAFQMGSGNTVNIEVSTNGNSWDQVYEINSANHIATLDYTTISLPIDIYAWQNIFIRFRQHKAAGSWIFMLDDVSITGDIDPIDHLSLFPTSASFDQTLIGLSSPPQIFTIRNFTETAATIQSIAIAGADPSHFNLYLNDNLPWTLSPNGGAKTFSASFAPNTIGSKTANIEIIDNLTNYNRTLYEIPLTGLGIQYYPPQNLSYVTEPHPMTPGTYQIRLSWAPPPAGGQGYNIGYKIYKNGVSVIPTYFSLDVQSYLDTSLENGQEYSYYATAVYVNPDFAESIPSNIITLVIAPPPFDIIAAPGNHQVHLQWNIPPRNDEINNSRALSGFTIERMTSNTGYWTIVHQTTDLTDLSWTNIDLINGLPYYYRVLTEYTNPDAVSEPSEIAGPVVPHFWYPPQNLFISIVSDLLILIWEAPTDTGTMVIGYKIYRGTQENNLTEIFVINSGLWENMAWIDNTGITPGALYYYSIKTSYPGGDSDFSIIVNTGGVTEDDSTILPLITELIGNYPNPFNPETTINFALSITSNLRVDIYNIKGQLVRSLIDEEYPAGYHKILWNGTDNYGDNVSSGIYFYKMSTEEYTSVKRMMMVK